jgi:hypothetical protein
MATGLVNAQPQRLARAVHCMVEMPPCTPELTQEFAIVLEGYVERELPVIRGS